jgi:LacI family transcriptional regulator
MTKGSEAGILGNRRRRKDGLVTIRNVAEATGLSVATVSMVLNGVGRRIPPATQRLVQEKAKEVGYSPNVLARSLRSKRTRSVGVLVFDIADPYCSLMIRGIDSFLGDAGYLPVLADLQNNPKRFGQCIRMFMERRVEGLIAIANPISLSGDLSAIFQDYEVPIVIIGGEMSGDRTGSVVVDNSTGTRVAVEYLYKLGHREFAVIKGPRAMSDSAPRWKGIVKSFREKGIRIDRSNVVQIQGLNSSYEQGYKLTEKLLAGGGQFTALLAFDDLTACAAITALTQAGVRVPDDCSVVGFDDVPIAAFYNPPLTTVRQHLERQGTLGAQMMQRLLSPPQNGLRETLHEVVEPHLVIRQSTAPPPA